MPSAHASQVMPSTATSAVARHAVPPAVRRGRLVGQQAGDLERERRAVSQPPDRQLLDRGPATDRARLEEIGRPVLDVDHHAVGCEEAANALASRSTSASRQPRASCSGVRQRRPARGGAQLAAARPGPTLPPWSTGVSSCSCVPSSSSRRCSSRRSRRCSPIVARVRALQDRRRHPQRRVSRGGHDRRAVRRVADDARGPPGDDGRGDARPRGVLRRLRLCGSRAGCWTDSASPRDGRRDRVDGRPRVARGRGAARAAGRDARHRAGGSRDRRPAGAARRRCSAADRPARRIRERCGPRRRARGLGGAHARAAPPAPPAARALLSALRKANVVSGVWLIALPRCCSAA